MDATELKGVIGQARERDLPPDIWEACARQGAVDSVTLKVLAALMIHLRPSVTVEFGSGTSTQYMASLAEDIPDAQVVSVDNIERYLSLTRKGVAGAAPVTFQHAPTGLWWFRGCPFVTYGTGYRASLPDTPVQLVFIDGPYGRIFGREGALFQLADRLAQSAVVLLHDSHREREQETLGWWRAAWGEQMQTVDVEDVPTGLTAVWLPDPSRRRRLPFGPRRILDRFRRAAGELRSGRAYEQAQESGEAS